jgi:hypothetical protein
VALSVTVALPEKQSPGQPGLVVPLTLAVVVGGVASVATKRASLRTPLLKS